MATRGRNSHEERSRQNENAKDKSVHVNKRVSQPERVRKQKHEEKDITRKETDGKDSNQKGIQILSEKKVPVNSKKRREPVLSFRVDTISTNSVTFHIEYTSIKN